MTITIKLLSTKIKQNQLYQNSFFIMLSRFLNAGIGFIFWIVAARLYSIENVGIATALLSSIYIITSFSRLGFDFSLIRYIPINDRTKVFNTSFVITTIASFLIGIIFITIGINSFSPSLFFIQKPVYAIIFLLITAMYSVVTITGVAFTAIRKADRYFYQNIFLASRVPLLMPLVFLGSFGIIGSVGIAYSFSALIAFLQLNKFIKFDFKIDNQFIKESFNFSFGNYVSNVFNTVPILILPILIINLLGEAESAKYYIAFAIGSLVLIIPDALCTALFIEGSHGENLRKNVIKALLTIYSFLIPAVIIIYFFGNHLLTLIGENYVDAFKLLMLIALSSFLVTINHLFISIQNVRMNVTSIIKLNFILFLLLPILSYIFIPRFGITGIGYAWMIVYGILDLIIVILVKNAGWL